MVVFNHFRIRIKGSYLGLITALISPFEIFLISAILIANGKAIIPQPVNG